MEEPTCVIPGREAAVSDIADLVGRFFTEEGFDLPSDIDHRVLQYVREAGHVVLLAYRGDTAIGFATAARGFSLEYGRYAEMEDLYVMPQERRTGVAKRLVQEIGEWARDQGCSVLLVTVTPEGERSHGLKRFYGGLGFQDRGRMIPERPLSQDAPGGSQ